MESVIPEGTPLSSLLEGEGQHEGVESASEGSSSPTTRSNDNFAPPTSTRLRACLRTPALARMSALLPRSRNLRQSWSRAFSMTIEASENAHFLEHFRYVIVASQLLDESPDHALLQATAPWKGKEMEFDAQSGRIELTYVGASISAGVAFSAVWLTSRVHSGTLSTSRFLVVALCGIVTAIGLYIWLRHHILRHLRKQAIDCASNLMAALQAFEVTSTAALTIIQEVEVVAKGYRFSTPLPPVSRLDDAKTLRRCMPLRRQLFRSYQDITKCHADAHVFLQQIGNLDDYEKYLDVYDVPREAVQEAFSMPSTDDLDSESLGVLRMMDVRQGTIRRALLCDLLSLDASGCAADRLRWRQANTMLAHLVEATIPIVESLAQSLKELENFAPSLSPKPASKHSNDRLRTQVRKISNLSTGIRSLQAKMTLLREESNAALARADDLTDLGPSLMSQYESIGADIQALLRDWETGKTALSSNIIKHERRISHASSSGIRSPVSSSFNGLLAVDEGGPADALRALMGEGHSERSFSPRSSMPTTPSDEEVFEAVALPKPRSMLSREERIKLMHEERAKAEERREMRDSGVNMMKELRSVIKVRKRGHTVTEGTRITSL